MKAGGVERRRPRERKKAFRAPFCGKLTFSRMKELCSLFSSPFSHAADVWTEKRREGGSNERKEEKKIEPSAQSVSFLFFSFLFFFFWGGVPSYTICWKVFFRDRRFLR